MLKNRQRFVIITRVKKYHPQMVAEARSFERDLMNLALLPSKIIREAFEDLNKCLEDNKVLHEIMGPYFMYYRRHWISKVGPENYSVYLERNRSNNVTERYHRAFKALTATRPEIVPFFSEIQYNLMCWYLKKNLINLHFYLNTASIKTIQLNSHMDTLVLDHGQNPRREKDSKSIRKEEALRAAWHRFGDLGELDRENQRKKIKNFLKAVNPFTNLAVGKKQYVITVIINIIIHMYVKWKYIWFVKRLATEVQPERNDVDVDELLETEAEDVYIDVEYLESDLEVDNGMK